MSTLKKRLIALLIFQAILTLIHLLLKNSDPQIKIEAWPWHLWLGFATGILILVYALSISCSACHRKQVFRGLSAFDLRWPQENCYSCGVSLLAKYHKGKPIDP